jgi:hypothetical protein
LLLLEDLPEPLCALTSGQNLELPHKHNHDIHKRGVALHRVNSALANLLEEVVEGTAENQNLENLHTC